MKRIKIIFRIAEMVANVLVVFLCVAIMMNTTNVVVCLIFTLITPLYGGINLIEFLDFLTEMRKK